MLVAGLVSVIDVVLFSDIVAEAATGAARSPAAPTVAYALAGSVLLAIRRHAPVMVFIALCVHAVVLSLFTSYGPLLPVCVALATLVARHDLRVAATALLVASVPVVGWVSFEVRTSLRSMRTTEIALLTVSHYGILFVAAGVGRWQHVVRAQRAAATREAVAIERLTLARELHDIVAHAVTVMLLQAAGARRVMAVDPKRTEDALASIEDAGVRAVGELRRLLAVLRAGDASADGAAGSAPLHEIDDIDTLIDGFRRTGLRVTFDTRGSTRRVDSSVGLTAYRVVQEALTNAGRHGGDDARATVVLDWRPEALVVNVCSEGAGSRTRRTKLSTGYGLVGLTERVALVDGELRFERSPGDGFEVTASLPLADAAPVRS